MNNQTMKNSCIRTRRCKNIYSFIILVFTLNILLSLNVSCQTPVQADSIVYFDGQSFNIIGKFHSEKNYVRFPERYKNTLRKEVWDLSQNSAGISVRFRTNSSVIEVRWTAKNDYSMDHMPETGVKGVDLYAFTDCKWRYVNTGRVKGKYNDYTLVQTSSKVSREYLLNLPLYDGVDSLSIGITSNSVISKPEERYLLDEKPVVYYGTSIAQGGCASRPGMAFTNILSRELDRSFINMGFSGNGNCELSVGEAMCEIDAALYVIDCNPNTKAEEVYERTVELVRLLKEKRPDIPVLLVEGFSFEVFLKDQVYSEPGKKNIELHRAYIALRESGIKQLYYMKGSDLTGSDHEGTVDGIHPNDLGMMRIAESLKPVIQKIVK
jgi:hypothetical protein